ncbi:protein translocase subunit SecF [Paenibacillus motobuensis]|uniref:protein translocase subunit SecF n=1 Tax=Paenibacillus TaxID=44249 RepID=UPI00204032AB|nr:protein translocase subunit SecF [Paenibacillus lutimineralis]MCM3649281.1 protein translocase subunit SecF [Paenibacillus motobuensis]
MRFVHFDKSIKRLDYVHLSKYFFAISIALIVLGVASLSFFGLNYSVDFQSGSNVDVTVSKSISKGEIESIVKDLDIAEGTTINVGEERISIRFTKVLNEDQDVALKKEISKLDESAAFEVNTVDTEMAKELAQNAIKAVLIACLGIIIYVSIRFEWRFAIAAVISLLHDAILVIAIFSIFQLKVDLTFIVAVLTIIGYSINDTIVIFDRIRENMRFAKLKTRDDLKELVDHSIAQTIMRSIYTVLTVFIAAFFLFLLGGESIKMFSLAMTIGLVLGAYSTIFIASPLWFVLKVREKKKPAKAA